MYTRAHDVTIDYEQIGGSDSKFRDPLHSYYAAFMPKDLSQLMAFNDIVYHSSTDVKSALQKFVKYAAANLEITFAQDRNGIETNEETRRKIVNKLGLLTFIQNVGIDYYITGNVATLILPPKTKTFVCPSCGNTVLFASVTKQIDGISGNKPTYTVVEPCIKCGHKAKGLACTEEYDVNSQTLNLINWPASYIAIEKSPFSNSARYYLEFPPIFEKEYLSKSQVFLNDTPERLLAAIYQKKKFLVQNKYIHFLKAKPIASSFGKFGMPPLTDAIFRFIHAEILKRGNEAISLDHTVPLDIIYPNPPSSAGLGGGIIPFNLREHRHQIEKVIAGHRKDATRINFLPFPLGIQQLKNTGKALNLSSDIEYAEAKIADSFGVPREFFTGTLNFTAAPLALKLLENQMRELFDGLNNLLVQVVDVMKSCGIKLFSNIVEIRLEEFKTADNLEYGAALRELYSMGKISDATYGKYTKIDLRAERKHIREEALESIKEASKTQKATEVETLSFGEQAKQMAANSGADNLVNPHSPENIQMQAEAIAQELLMGGSDKAKSVLAQLKGQDYIMYAVVRTRYQELKYQQDRESEEL